MKNMLLKNKAVILLAFIGFLSIYNILNLGFWKKQEKIIMWDVLEYYSYLPATFIFKDPLLTFMNDNPEAYYDRFWPLTTDNGNNVIKMSMGISFLYSPFFFTAHGYALISKYPANGYSEPYRIAIIFSTIVFFLLGLFFLSKILSRYFKPLIVSLTLLAVSLGTNLYYYVVVNSGMSHAYSFALLTIFIWLTLKWYEKKNWKLSLFIGLCLGMISLIRPTNSIILIFFLLWNVSNFSGFKSRITELLLNWKIVLFIGFFAFIVWIPQMLYWKAVSGQFLYYSYQDEGFFFNNPQFIKGLFSYRNGWLLYTPIMSFALLGIVLLYKRLPDFFIPCLLLIPLSIYIILSWWCWWYVGFGNRAFIDHYAILAIPLAAFLERMLQQKILLKSVFLSLFLFFLTLNLFQTWQYYKGYIRHDSMSKKAYWIVFGKTDPEDRFWPYLKYPDYNKAVKGIYVDKDKE